MSGTKKADIIKLIVSLGVCQAAGFIGSIFTRPAISTWYAELSKPRFTPPDWVFGPVWIALYILMGIAAFLVWRKGLDNKLVRLALLCFVVQLVLNALWTPLFFGLRSPLAGLIDIVLLLSAIDLTTILFLRISKPAGVLLVPYILWVFFAMILNASIFLLNR